MGGLVLISVVECHGVSLFEGLRDFIDLAQSFFGVLLRFCDTFAG